MEYKDFGIYTKNDMIYIIIDNLKMFKVQGRMICFGIPTEVFVRKGLVISNYNINKWLAERNDKFVAYDIYKIKYLKEKGIEDFAYLGKIDYLLQKKLKERLNEIRLYFKDMDWQQY